MNYLAGLTYPDYERLPGGGQGMLAPFCKLTIGQMYRDSYGYISSLSYAVQDNGTWETHFAKLPKYIQASCTFVYVGNRLPSKNQKHFEAPWIPDERIGNLREFLTDDFKEALRDRNQNEFSNFASTTSEQRLNALAKKLDFG